MKILDFIMSRLIGFLLIIMAIIFLITMTVSVLICPFRTRELMGEFAIGLSELNK